MSRDVSSSVRRAADLLFTGDRPSLVILRMGLSVIGAAWLLNALAAGLKPGYDTYAYWSVDLDRLYVASTSYELGAFRYSPLAAQVLHPFGAIPWDLYFVGFLVASLVALTILGGRLGLALTLVPIVLAELILGNIDLFLALAVPAGLVFPPAWILLGVTKFTPAVVVLWFAARGEWRKFLVVALGTAIVILPSVLTTPDLWIDWIRSSTQLAGGRYGASEIPILPRLAVAAVLVVIGARRDWRWTLAVGATLAMPGLDLKTSSIFLAILPLYGLGLVADWPAIVRRLRPSTPAGPVVTPRTTGV